MTDTCLSCFPVDVQPSTEEDLAAPLRKANTRTRLHGDVASFSRSEQITIINRRDYHTVAHGYNWTFSAGIGFKTNNGRTQPSQAGQGLLNSQSRDSQNSPFSFLRFCCFHRGRAEKAVGVIPKALVKSSRDRCSQERTRGQRSQSSPFAWMTHTDVTYDQTKEEQKLTLMSQESGEEEVLNE